MADVGSVAMKKRRSPFQRAYIALLITLGTASLLTVVHTGLQFPLPHPVSLLAVGLAFGIATYYGTIFETSTPGSPITFTVADAVLVFALLVIGPLGLLSFLLAATIVRYLKQRLHQPLGYLFNYAQLSMTSCVMLAGLSAAAPLAPSSHPGLPSGTQILGILVLYPVWEAGTMSLLISVGSGTPPFQVYRRQFLPTALIDAIPTAMGVLGATLYLVQPWLTLPALVPLFLAQHAIAQLSIRGQELEQRVAERTGELETALRAKDDFVAIVAHELRTPLTSIVGSLALLADPAVTALPPRTRRMLEVAHANSERLARLINDILDTQKLEADQMLFQLQPLDLNVLTAQVIDEQRAYATLLNITLLFRPAEQVCMVVADGDRLNQVLTNILANASKFSPPHASVEIAIVVHENNACVTVADHGPGIPIAFRDRVFEKFAQADTSANRRNGGTGLGLSIAKAIVEQLGGAIGFTSEVGQGTTFAVSFPLWQPADLDEHLAHNTERFAQEQAGGE